MARDLALSIQDKLCYKDPKRGVTSYLFNARVSDFRKYLDRNDVARLVARNIRYRLKGKIGPEVRKTYEEKPHDFWYLHNGLTLICDDYIEKDQVATLTNPSVVNGAQTLFAIESSSNKVSPALVAVRVIVRGNESRPIEDDEWIQRIIQGVNTQNRVRAYDFRSNNPEQVELQKLFREHKVFYERKRGEWGIVRNSPEYRNFLRLSLAKLGQVLAAVSDEGGHGVLEVKRGTEKLFAEDKLYVKLFPAKAKIIHRFVKIYLAYRTFHLLDKAGYKTAKDKRKQHHAFWNCLWLLHQGITSLNRFTARITLAGIKAAFDEFEGFGIWGRAARKRVRELTAAVWRAYQHGRRADPDKWSPANFFKSKYGNQVIRRLALPKVKKQLQGLGRRIIELS
jgi:hypothetical protein